MEDSFDRKDIEEQKMITKRDARVAALNHTKHLVNLCYSILFLMWSIILLFLFGISVFLSLYNNSFMFTGLLADVANAINTLKLESIILILVLAFIHVGSNFINSYFKKE